MILPLFLALIALTGVAYILERRDILSPWVISCVMFTISAFFALANAQNWGYSLSPNAVLVILSGLFAFGLASILVSVLVERHSQVKKVVMVKGRQDPQKPFDIPGAALVMIIVLMTGIFLYIFIKTYQFSVEQGNTYGISQMIKYARQGLLQPGNNLGRIVGHLNLISECMQLVFLYIFLHNCLLCVFRKKWLLYLLPIGIDIAVQTLGTGRIFMINMASSILIIGFVLYNFRYGWSRQLTLRIIAAGAAALLLFFIVFTLLGYLTGKSQLRSVWDMISIYTGLSIPSLDVFLSSPREEPSIWGEETLYGLHNILRTLGMDIPVDVRHLEFVSFGEASGNVYTSLRRYIHDYGFAGMLIVQFLLGVLYSAFYQFIKHKDRAGFSLIIYSWMFYALVMQGIDEQVLCTMISTTPVYKLTYLFIIYYSLQYLSRKRTMTVVRKERVCT